MLSPAQMEGLWWTMHHSEHDWLQTAAIQCYLDESGTDDHSPTAVLGGIVLQRQAFIHFNESWAAVLTSHGITPPIHMKEFGRPHGRLSGLDDKQRRDLFSDLVEMVNHHKVISLAAVVTTADFHRHFDDVFSSKLMSIYGTAFLMTVVLAHNAAEHIGLKDEIAYLLDRGNRYRNHIHEGHDAAYRLQETSFLHVKGLAFEDDRSVHPLQAADMVAWAVRRSLHNGLRAGFEPLARLFERNHVESRFDEPLMIETAAALKALGTPEPEPPEGDYD